jgi:ABC-type xylose transport system permease subunit
MADGLWQQLGISLPDVIAGFCGGVVNAFVFKRVEPWAMVGSVVVGTLTANYLGPLIGHYIGSTGGAPAFITGLAGMALCQGIVDAASKWRIIGPKGDKDV